MNTFLSFSLPPLDLIPLPPTFSFPLLASIVFFLSLAGDLFLWLPETTIIKLLKCCLAAINQQQ